MSLLGRERWLLPPPETSLVWILTANGRPQERGLKKASPDPFFTGQVHVRQKTQSITIRYDF